MPAISQTWCAASKATTGSDAAKYPPSESVPERQRAPASPDVAHASAAARAAVDDPPGLERRDDLRAPGKRRRLDLRVLLPVGRIHLAAEDRRSAAARPAFLVRARRVRLRHSGRQRSARRRRSDARHAGHYLAIRAGDRRAGRTPQPRVLRAGSASSSAIGADLGLRTASAPMIAIASPAVPATANASSVPPVAESQPTMRPPSGARPFHA